jgi:lactate dehydrogenase-like 2-hydroxyacid dehydrogenase
VDARILPNSWGWAKWRFMNQPHILLTAPMHPIVEATLKPHAVLHRLWEQPNPAAALEAMGPQIRAMAASSLFGRVDGALLDSLPALEVIASFGVGYDHIDAQAAAERGIIVTNTPDVLTEEVADFTLGLLLATLRQIPQAERFVRDGHWLERKFPLSPSLRGRRVGIVGMGAIGKAVARRLEGFGVDIAYHSRHPPKRGL